MLLKGEGPSLQTFLQINDPIATALNHQFIIKSYIKSN